MTKDVAHIPQSQNALLSSLPTTEYQVMQPYLRRVNLPFKKMLYPARSAITEVYFPIKGVVSAVTYINGGMSIEVATIGNEGLVGVPALLGEFSSPNEVYMQVAGEGWQISATDLRRVAVPGSTIYHRLVKYLNAYLFQISQTVACNGLHEILKRCCRWLLMTQDRVNSSELHLTHEFLAVMLGVRRASVSDVLAPLQKDGVIRCERGVITIVDRKTLEQSSCECYQLVRDEFQRLLG